MIRRLLIPLVASGVLLAAGASTVLGKCEGPNPPSFCAEIMVNLDVGGSGGILRAGTTTSVDVYVSQGEQPYDAVGVALNFTHTADRAVVRAAAIATGTPGLWRAEVTLPDNGSWTVVAAVVDGNGNAFNLRTDPIQVAKAPTGTPATPATPASPISPTTPALPIALLVAGIATAALLAIRMQGRARRRAKGAPAGGGGSPTASTPSTASGERA